MNGTASKILRHLREGTLLLVITRKISSMLLGRRYELGDSRCVGACHWVMRGGRVSPRLLPEVMEMVRSLEVSRIPKAPHRGLFAASRDEIVPACCWCTVMRCLLRVLAGRSIWCRGHLSADAIRIGNNVLAFYKKRGEVVKLFYHSDKQKNHLEGTSWARTHWDFLRVPEVFAVGEDPVPWVAERLIHGRKPTGVEFTRSGEQIIRELLKLHFSESYSTMLEVAPEWPALLHEKMLEAGTPNRKLVERVTALTHTSYCVVEGKRHGDLAPYNILRSGDCYYVLDWEDYGYGYPCLDLRELLPFIPAIALPYNKRLETLADQAGKSPVPLRPQIGLLTLMQLCAHNVPSKQYFLHAGSADMYKPLLEQRLEQVEEFVAWAEAAT